MFEALLTDGSDERERGIEYDSRLLGRGSISSGVTYSNRSGTMFEIAANTTYRKERHQSQYAESTNNVENPIPDRGKRWADQPDKIYEYEDKYYEIAKDLKLNTNLDYEFDKIEEILKLE